MRSSSLLVLSFALLSIHASGQQLSAGDRDIVEMARARYYNLEAAGFQSLRCSVKFDFSTVPLLSSASDGPTRNLLAATEFTLALDSNGRPNVEHRYPSDTSENARQQASQLTNLLTSFIVGLFQTWPTKGLQGPIPPFDSQIESVIPTDAGYTFSLRVPGAPVKVLMDKNYLVTEIVSGGGKIDERPIYVPSHEGLLFVGNDAIDNSGASGPVEVKYELETSVLDGLMVPSSARLRVNQNIDVKFALDGCSLQKAKVLHVDPPQARQKP
jgi:hypothetical protein